MTDEPKFKRAVPLTPEQRAAISARADELAQTGGVFVGGDGFAAFVDGGDSAFHPYECRAGCNHCARRKTEHHDPDKCAICAYDAGEEV